MKDEAEILTTSAAFDDIPVIDNQLFEVRPGIPAAFAIGKAFCLADSIMHLAIEAVSSGTGMEPEKAYLIQGAAEMIRALMESIDGAWERSEGAT